MAKLTALAVKAATQPGRYQDGDGLMLVVKKPGKKAMQSPDGGDPSSVIVKCGSRSWQVRVQVDGKRRDFGLGSTKELTLAEAREKAAAIRKQYKSGLDPVAQRKLEKLARMESPPLRRRPPRRIPNWFRVGRMPSIKRTGFQASRPMRFHCLARFALT